MKDTIDNASVVTWFVKTETAGNYSGKSKSLRAAVLAARNLEDPMVGREAKAYYYDSNSRLIRVDVNDGKKWSETDNFDAFEAMNIASCIENK